MVRELAADFAVPGTQIYDLGCSTGTTLLPLDSVVDRRVRFVGVDNSEERLAKCREKFVEHGIERSFDLQFLDLNQGIAIENASVVMMILTLQFIRPLHRDQLMAHAYRGLSANGCLILVEKVLGEDSLLANQAQFSSRHENPICVHSKRPDTRLACARPIKTDGTAGDRIHVLRMKPVAVMIRRLYMRDWTGPKAMRSDMQWWSAVQTREQIVAGNCSAVEVVTASLTRIERLNPKLRAFVTVDREGALEAARAADAAQAAGKALGPLHGVPVAIKDDLWVKDLPATCGSLLFADFRPSFDGTVAERLRAAGAIIVGKTNMPEFAAWPRSKSFIAGETVNPWDVACISGASSGGSGAAVASGMVPVAIGTDGGGSTRIPSALNGLVGLFPPIGRIPSYGSFCCSPTESAGPMARSVIDAATVEQVIAGPDPRNSNDLKDVPPDVLANIERGVDGIKAAWSDDYGWIEVDPDVLAAARACMTLLLDAGAEVVETRERIGHPWADASSMAALHVAVAAAGDPPPPDSPAPSMHDAEAWLTESSRHGTLLFLLPQFQALVAQNLHLLAPPHAATMRHPPNLAGLPHETELAKPVLRLLAEHDVICCPTMANIAPIAPRGWASAYPNAFMGTEYTFIANSLRLPAVTIPCGLVRGLPAGIHIMGRTGAEATVLRVARAIEKRLEPLRYPEL